MCREAGMPERTLSTYQAFQEALRVRNGIAGALGKPYAKRASIPQGCLLSMMLVALYTRPRLSLMESSGVEGRVLADDILILAGGRKMLRRFGKALHLTHEYMEDAGARIAPDKSYNFASNQKAAKWLEATTWTKSPGEDQGRKGLQVLGSSPQYYKSQKNCYIGCKILQRNKHAEKIKAPAHYGQGKGEGRTDGSIPCSDVWY